MFRYEETIADANVTGHAHFGKIQTFDFDSLIRTKSDHQIDHLEHDESKDADRDDIRCNSDAFREEL